MRIVSPRLAQIRLLTNPNPHCPALQEWIIIFGCIQLVLSQFPTIHHLRQLNTACTICTAGFAVSATALAIYAGTKPKHSQNYQYLH